MKKESTNPVGRPPGIPNKTTTELKSIWNKFISHNIEGMQEEYDKIEKPENKLKFMLDATKYLYPAISQIEIMTNDKTKGIPMITWVQTSNTEIKDSE